MCMYVASCSLMGDNSVGVKESVKTRFLGALSCDTLTKVPQLRLIHLKVSIRAKTLMRKLSNGSILFIF